MECKQSHTAVISTPLKYLFKKYCLATEMTTFVYHVVFCDVDFYNRNVMTQILLLEAEVITFFFSEFLYS